ncbi:damage-control phosphatase ARMT1 isoform X2 [Hydra vulgaris]|uniref:Sugar phosphate phosphatase n=1 Tax=Hydra vulgaris TaxID=6087 RepID=A0ABM4CG14_HYDVU
MSNTCDPRPASLSGIFKGTFAYLTIRDRMPAILTKVIDQMSRLASQYYNSNSLSKAEDAKEIVSKVCKLKNEMQTNKVIRKLNDSSDDSGMWNQFIEKMPILVEGETKPSWFTVPWLHCECYMYRRIIEALLESKFHTEFDPYFDQKADAFLSSIDAIKVLACYLNNLESINSQIYLYKSFEDLLEYSLWSNKCDLSISFDGNNPIKSADEQNYLKANIISNHTDQLWAYLDCMRLSNEKGIITFVLDNVGFELFSDLCLADFLLTFKFCAEIHFHVKCMPWFVSDTTAKDFFWTIEQCVNSTDKNISGLGKKWQSYLDNNLFNIVEDKFWTLPYDYSMLEQETPSLYLKLSRSKLILFKGDLNYRKLFGDRNWPCTTNIKDASSGFLPAPWCTLRTLKAEVVVGLLPGVSEKLESKLDRWMTSGVYGVVQFCI